MSATFGTPVFVKKKKTAPTSKSECGEATRCLIKSAGPHIFLERNDWRGSGTWGG